MYAANPEERAALRGRAQAALEAVLTGVAACPFGELDADIVCARDERRGQVLVVVLHNTGRVCVFAGAAGAQPLNTRATLLI